MQVKPFDIRLLAIATMAGLLGGALYQYLEPRLKDRFATVIVQPLRSPKEVVCEPSAVFVLEAPTTILRVADDPVILTQNVKAIKEYSTMLQVIEPGVVDINLKLEAIHRGVEYSDVIGVGARISYQYSNNNRNWDSVLPIEPTGWIGGTNIRDLRDHYGQVNIVTGLKVVPGYYRFCVLASAHSSLTTRSDLAAILVEKEGSLNTLRFNYLVAGRLFED